MRRVVAGSLLAALLLVVSVPGDAWSRGRHGHRGSRHGHPGFRSHSVVVLGPSLWWGPFWWQYPPSFGPYAPPPVQEPPVYVQQPAPPQAYWYYCPSARLYYPSVPTCPEAWIEVPPRQD